MHEEEPRGQEDSALLSSPSLQLAYDLNNSIFYKQNEENVIYALTREQLPVMKRVALLNIELSKGHIVEPHWHPNAAELVYTVSGEAIVSVLDPYSKKVLTYRIGPNQSVILPQAWWHWIIATRDDTQLTASFDNGEVSTVFGSDVLRLTPPDIFQLAYGVNAEQLARVLSPIRGTVVIGPPSSRMATENEGNCDASGAYGVKWRIGENRSAE